MQKVKFSVSQLNEIPSDALSPVELDEQSVTIDERQQQFAFVDFTGDG